MRLINLFSLLSTIVLAVVLSAGCAPLPQPPSSQGTSANHTVEVRRMQSTLSSQERSLQELNQQVVDLNTRVDLQQKELDQLRSQINQTRQSEAAGQTGAVPPDGRRSEQLSQLATQIEGTPTDIYLRAFGDYANSRFASAILGFQTFLQNFPNNSYASNAQFWMADSYLKQQQLPTAIEEFNKMLQLYPRAAKAADALLKIATAQQQLGNPQRARETLEILYRQYPESSAAKKATQLNLP